MLIVLRLRKNEKDRETFLACSSVFWAKNRGWPSRDTLVWPQIHSLKTAGLGICSCFSERIACFLRKNEQMSDLLKKTSDLLIRIFLVRDQSESLTVSQFWWATWAREWAIRSLFKKTYKKMYKRYNFIQIFLAELLVFSLFCERKSKWAKKTLIRSFISSDLSKLLMLIFLSWGTWSIRSRSLFCHEQPERLARSYSFVLGDLSDSLTVTH